MTNRLATPKPNNPVKEATFRFVAITTGCADSLQPFECVRNAPADALSKANKNAIKV